MFAGNCLNKPYSINLMKLLRYVILSAIAATVALPAFNATALPTKPAVVAQSQTTAPLLLYVKRIRNASTPGYIKIEGYVTNQTNEDQEVGLFDYKLWDRATRKYVAVHTGAINKTIPPGGKVVFESFIEKGDVGGVPPSRLVLELVRFR